MKRTKTRQPVDCVALKRQAQAKIYDDTKDMSPAEQIAYFRRRAESGGLGAWWKRVSNLGATPLAVHETPGKYGK
jgi:hypothetical protein